MKGLKENDMDPVVITALAVLAFGGFLLGVMGLVWAWINESLDAWEAAQEAAWEDETYDG